MLLFKILQVDSDGNTRHVQSTGTIVVAYSISNSMFVVTTITSIIFCHSSFHLLQNCKILIFRMKLFFNYITVFVKHLIGHLSVS